MLDINVGDLIVNSLKCDFTGDFEGNSYKVIRVRAYSESKGYFEMIDRDGNVYTLPYSKIKRGDFRKGTKTEEALYGF